MPTDVKDIHVDPKKLVIVIHDQKAGGAQRQALKVALGLKKKGWKVNFVVLEHTGKIILTDEQFEFTYLKSPKSFHNKYLRVFNIIVTIYRILSLRKTISDLSPHTILSFVSTTNILSIVASLGKKWKVVISERNDPDIQILRFPWELIRRHLYTYADVVTANTKSAVESMNTWVDKKKLVYIPNIIDIPEITINFNKKKIILMVGRLNKQKAHDILFKALAIIKDKLSCWTIRIIGTGTEYESLKKLSAELNIEELLQWVGVDKNVEQHYEEGAFLVLPSRYEGMPNVVLEAMSYKLPTVVSDASSGPLELVEDGVNGYVFPVDNCYKLSQCILSYITDKKNRDKMGLAAYERAKLNESHKILPLWESIL